MAVICMANGERIRVKESRVAVQRRLFTLPYGEFTTVGTYPDDKNAAEPNITISERHVAAILS